MEVESASLVFLSIGSGSFGNFPFVVRTELLTDVTMEKVGYATCFVLHFCSRGRHFWRRGVKLGKAGTGRFKSGFA